MYLVKKSFHILYKCKVIFYFRKTIKNNELSYSTNRNWIQIVLWELLAADIESIEGISAVGTVYN